jgi:hypothetical protein
MSDIHGPITHATIASGLWAIPLAPLIAAAWALYAFLAPVVRKKRKAPDALAVANVATLAAAFATGWSAFQTLKLSQLAESDRFLLEHVFRMVRFGQLDVAMDLAFDPLASVVLVTASAVAFLVFVVARGRMASLDAPRFFGWGSLLVSATLLVFLADGLVVAYEGWEVAAVAAWGLLGLGDAARARRGFVFARAADASILVGAAILFWGLGGVWIDNDYSPDLTPRFSAVRLGAEDDDEGGKKDEPEDKKEAQRTGGKGFITMNAYPGALVFMDDSRSPMMNGDAPLRSPFTRFQIPGGVHSFRIHPGNGLDDYLVSHASSRRCQNRRPRCARRCRQRKAASASLS